MIYDILEELNRELKVIHVYGEGNHITFFIYLCSIKARLSLGDLIFIEILILLFLLP